MRLSLRISLIGVAIAALSGGIAIAATDNSSSSTPIASFSPTKVSPSSYLRVLNGPRSAAATTGRVAADFSGATTLNSRYQPDPAAAVLLGTTAGRAVQLVPANGAACLDVPDQSGPGTSISCEATQVITRGRLFLVEYPTRSSDQAQVFGVAPDGVTSVTGTAANGQTVTVPVKNNSYELTLTGLRSLQIGSDTAAIGAPLGGP